MATRGEYFDGDRTYEEIDDPNFFNETIEDEIFAQQGAIFLLGAVSLLPLTAGSMLTYKSLTDKAVHTAHQAFYEQPAMLQTFGALQILGGLCLLYVAARLMREPDHSEYIEQHKLIQVPGDDGKLIYRRVVPKAYLYAAYKDRSGLDPLRTREIEGLVVIDTGPAPEPFAHAEAQTSQSTTGERLEHTEETPPMRNYIQLRSTVYTLHLGAQNPINIDKRA